VAARWLAQGIKVKEDRPRDPEPDDNWSIFRPNLAERFAPDKIKEWPGPPLNTVLRGPDNPKWARLYALRLDVIKVIVEQDSGPKWVKLPKDGLDQEGKPDKYAFTYDSAIDDVVDNALEELYHKNQPGDWSQPERAKKYVIRACVNRYRDMRRQPRKPNKRTNPDASKFADNFDDRFRVKLFDDGSEVVFEHDTVEESEIVPTWREPQAERVRSHYSNPEFELLRPEWERERETLRQEREQQRRKREAAFASLSESDQEILTLRLVDTPYSVIAARRGISEAAARKQVQRAREHLEQAWQDWDVTKPKVYAI